MPNARSGRLVVGLTGGMGSGKSTVLAYFKMKGAQVLDADQIVHELLKKDHAVLRAIKRTFGADVFDASGLVNRKALAARAFISAAQRRKLEKILHPRVRQRIWNDLKKSKNNVSVVDIPLLYESKWEGELDGVVVVDATLRTRLRRLKKKGFALADAKRRIRQQMDLKTKVKRADFVVKNNGSLAQTKKQVDAIWKKLPTLTHGGH